MIGAEILDALLAAGASAQMIVDAVKAAGRAEEDRRREARQRDAERKRRKRRTEGRTALSGEVRHRPADSADISPYDNISNPSIPPSSEEDGPPGGLNQDLERKIVAAWNDGPAAAGAMRCRGLNPSRRKSLAARRREHGEGALFEAIRNLAGSSFHCGGNDREWRASLGWLLTSPETFQRMLERTAAGPPPLSAAERAASLERSAAMLDRMGRTDEAAEMRRSAANIRAAATNQKEDGR